jgi:Nucleotidyl transferase AbiEii toxin, Type IV TA system
MTLLHFRRTFIEKLFAIHGKIERFKADGHPLGRDARHYADIHTLAGTDEVMAMLDSTEYRRITILPGQLRPPPGLSFAASEALFPPDALRSALAEDYERECARLFYRPHPPFDDVLGRLEGLRELL